MIRNIIDQSNRVADNYKMLSCKQTQKNDSQKQLLRAIHHAKAENAGISMTVFNNVLMDEKFLMYVSCEFERYVEELNIAILNYQAQMGENY